VTDSVAGIVPRWEWRTFADGFGEADAHFDAAIPDLVRESNETYILSVDSDASVKVRDGLMDVKLLEHVNGDGVEQWRPVLKGSFPLSASHVRSVLLALGAEEPDLKRDAYKLDEFLDEIVRPSSGIRSVAVYKNRKQYSPGGCRAERTEIRSESRVTHTVAFESEDPDLVIATVRSFGLDDRPDVCMARGLKSLVGFDAVSYAVIDVGTNSVKFHVAEHRPDGTFRTLIDRAEITRLGEGLGGAGALGAEPIRRTVDAIADMADEARRNGVAAVAAVGTAGMRIADNSSELVDAVRERTGIGIDVISGDDEARLAFLAATAALDVGKGTLVVFDTGGGSSQFTFGHDRRIDEQFSVEVGAARFTEQFGLNGIVSEETVASAREAIAADLARLDGRARPDALVGLGGAVTNLASVKHGLAVYDPNVVQGTQLDREEVDRQIELYRQRTVEERRQIVGLQPKRAEVILAGACVVRTVLDKLQCDSFTVSDRGLRHGVLAERFG
jgi:exopolyphosphatase/guanosine-5'-triphosphate,3'-diphosphate pyrophosphatase